MTNTLTIHNKQTVHEHHTLQVRDDLDLILTSILSLTTPTIPRHPYHQPSVTPFTVPVLTLHIPLLPGPGDTYHPPSKDKSPDPSGLTPRFLQYCGVPLIIILNHLLTRIWNLHAVEQINYASRYVLSRKQHSF